MERHGCKRVTFVNLSEDCMCVCESKSTLWVIDTRGAKHLHTHKWQRKNRTRTKKNRLKFIDNSNKPELWNDLNSNRDCKKERKKRLKRNKPIASINREYRIKTAFFFQIDRTDYSELSLFSRFYFLHLVLFLWKSIYKRVFTMILPMPYTMNESLSMAIVCILFGEMWALVAWCNIFCYRICSLLHRLLLAYSGYFFFLRARCCFLVSLFRFDWLFIDYNVSRVWMPFFELPVVALILVGKSLSVLVSKWLLQANARPTRTFFCFRIGISLAVFSISIEFLSLFYSLHRFNLSALYLL